MTTNQQPTFDLNTIIQAALSAAIAQSTAALAARVDNLEQQLATQSDTIGALVRGLEAAERGIERLESVVLDANGAPVAPAALSFGTVDQILADVRVAIADAMNAHERTADHLSGEDVANAIGSAISTHERDAQHLTEHDVENAIDDAIKGHERDTEHGFDVDSDEAHDAIVEVVQNVLSDATITGRVDR